MLQLEGWLILLRRRRGLPHLLRPLPEVVGYAVGQVRDEEVVVVVELLHPSVGLHENSKNLIATVVMERHCLAELYDELPDLLFVLHGVQGCRLPPQVHNACAELAEDLLTLARPLRIRGTVELLAFV